MEYNNYHSELETIKRKIVKLEQENKNLQFELYQATNSYKEAINKISVPFLLFDKSGKIQFCNDYFITLLNFKGRELAQKNRDIKDIHILELVDNELYDHLQPFINRGATFEEKYIEMNNFTYNLSVHSIRKGELGVAIFKSVTTKDEKNEDMMRRLEGVIETNIEMIQKIGSLMGEEVSKDTEILSSIIKMIK